MQTSNLLFQTNHNQLSSSYLNHVVVAQPQISTHFEQTSIFLINITGKDRPGLFATFTRILGEHNVDILDIGQAVIHDYLSLGILVEIPSDNQSASVLKDLLFAGHELDIAVKFTPVHGDQYEEWVADQRIERRVITLLGRQLSAQQIAAVAAVTAEHNLNIDVITRLSGRISRESPENDPRACVQFLVTGELQDDSPMRVQLLELARETGIDIAFHVDDIYRHNRRLVVFDMDSTLIQAEVIDELAKAAGVGEQVIAITEAAMRGEIDFKESLSRRVGLLKGLDEGVLADIADNLPLTEGLERVTTTLKTLGYKIGILSGGFDYFGKHLQDKLGFDYMFANSLEIVDGKLTGRVLGEVVDGNKKAELLRVIAQAEGLNLEQTIAVGDGANDIPMLTIAGLGVAFHAKPIVKKQAKRTISSVGLDGLLYLIGLRERDIRQ